MPNQSGQPLALRVPNRSGQPIARGAPHRHKWSVSTIGPIICFSCSCGAQFQRPMSATERKAYRLQDLVKPPPAQNVHRVWHAFQTRFLDRKGAWRWVGYALIERVKKWAGAYPADVRVVGCDDDHFCTSDLVLIEHRARDQYMGTTVVYIPQCTAEQPIRFFLYPGHRLALHDALIEIARVALPIQKRANQRLRQGWKRKRAATRFPTRRELVLAALAR